MVTACSGKAVPGSPGAESQKTCLSISFRNSDLPDPAEGAFHEGAWRSSYGFYID